MMAPASPAQYQQALLLLFASEARERRWQLVEQALQLAQQEDPPLDGLICAFRQQHLVGVVRAELSAGRTAVVWPARLAVGEPASTADRLLQSAEQHLRENRVVMAQAVLPPQAADDKLMLEAAGYRAVANLLYMFCHTGVISRESVSHRLRYQTYRHSERARLGRLIERTYVDTLDCPSLNGVRSVEDVLDGYQQTGKFDQQRWFFVRHEEADIGCLLLNDHPAEDQWELVYMGLIPEVRGQGFGHAIARHAQRLATAAGRSRIVLAVDEANVPAVEMYAAAGFTSWERRLALIKLLDCRTVFPPRAES